jgi:alkylation response protein AidB-like acyl-CoA dehydrogenase
MYLGLTEEQRAMRDLCAGLLDDGRPEDSVWKRSVEAGLPSALVPEEHGGPGLGAAEAVVIAETAGRAAVATPLAATLGLTALARAASLERTLRAVVGGSPGAVVAGGAFRTVPPPDQPAPDACAGGLLGLALRSSAVMEAVALTCPADDLKRLRSLDSQRPVCLITLTPRRLRDAERGPVREPGWLRLPALLRAAEALGASARLLELAAEHARQRRQFGQAIGAFQGVKHRLVDAELEVERARSLLYGAVATPADESGAARTAAFAVRAAAQAVRRAARTGVHVHGAIGLTVEHPASGLYARARQLAAVLQVDCTVSSI